MIENLQGKAQQFLKNKKALLFLGGLSVLAMLKWHFKGGVCKADKDLSGQVVVITGGSTGIGRQTIKELTKKGCTLIFGARDKAKSQELVKQIRQRNAECQIFYFPLDLANKQSIEQFVENIKQVCDCVNILINNAGVFMSKRRQTVNGFEMTMGVNHLGHFYLTHLLWKLLKAADKPRIINVSSEGHRGNKNVGALDFDDMNLNHNFEGPTAYMRSKMANVLFAKELQAKMREVGIRGSAFSLHPGVIASDIGRDLQTAYRIGKVVLFPLTFIFLKSVWGGAQTTLYLALEQDEKLEGGEYYKDCKKDVASPFTSNMNNAKRLWKKSEEMLGIKFQI